MALSPPSRVLPNLPVSQGSCMLKKGGMLKGCSLAGCVFRDRGRPLSVQFLPAQPLRKHICCFFSFCLFFQTLVQMPSLLVLTLGTSLFRDISSPSNATTRRLTRPLPVSRGDRMAPPTPPTQLPFLSSLPARCF